MLNKFKKFFGSEAPVVKQPVFVVGCGRSGTTLLFDILSEHPVLARTTGYPDGEDHEGWIEHGKCVMAGLGNVNHEKYGSGINGYQYCLHMTKEDVNEEIIQAMHTYYWNEVLSKKKKLRVINKQPHLSNKLDYVLEIFPDAKIVHIVRDCEQVVASWLAMMEEHPTFHAYWPREEEFPCIWLMPKPKDKVALNRIDRHRDFFPGGGKDIFIDYWMKINAGISKQMQGREDQLLSIRYEDLISKPVDVLSAILAFCELPSFPFKTDGLRSNTAVKHSHYISPEFKTLLAERSSVVRQIFGYEPSVSGAQENRLYLP